MDVGLFLGLFGFVLAAPAQQHIRRGGWCDFSQPAGRKDPPKDDPTATKTQLKPERPYKWHEGHSKSIQLRSSRRLHH